MFDDIHIRPGEEGARAALPDLEAEIMEIVWAADTDELDVSEVQARLNEDEVRDLAYTTVMTTMKRLFDKELLARRKEGRKYLYTPELSRSDFYAEVAIEVMKSLPDSGRQAAMSALIGDIAEADASTLERLERLIEKRKRDLEE
jgi:predicted transcriptional regulator